LSLLSWYCLCSLPYLLILPVQTFNGLLGSQIAVVMTWGLLGWICYLQLLVTKVQYQISFPKAVLIYLLPLAIFLGVMMVCVPLFAVLMVDQVRIHVSGW